MLSLPSPLSILYNSAEAESPKSCDIHELSQHFLYRLQRYSTHAAETGSAPIPRRNLALSLERRANLVR